MKIQFGGKEFFIQFSHTNNHQLAKHVVIDGKRYSRIPEESYTYSRIFSVTFREGTEFDYPPRKVQVAVKHLEAVGKAICLPDDQFVKDKGRRIALQKALKEYNATREFKQAVWKKYNEEMKLPKK